MGQVVVIDERRAEFRVIDRGGDVVPGGSAWDEAVGPAQSAFWDILARLIHQRKDEELAAGLDAKGEPIEPARVRIGRYAGAGGPGLMPFREFSRTRLLLTVTPGDGLVIGTWRGDWSTIVGYHARGLAGKGRPISQGGNIVAFKGIPGATTGIVRNVVGLSDRGLAWAIEQARSEWRSLFAPDEPAGTPSSSPTSRLDILGTIRAIFGINDRDARRGRRAA